MADAAGVETPVIWRARGNFTGRPLMKAPVAIDYWSELDGDILRALDEEHGAMAPAELGRRLGMSERAVCSILAMLASTGQVRIRSVERT
jgi:hypothetical protein